MDNSKNIKDTFIDIEFIRSQNLNKQDKIKKFWKFLDNQEILKPYKTPFVQEETPKNIAFSILSSSEATPKTKISLAKTKQKMKKDFNMKRNINTCKLEKYFMEGLKHADSIEVSYDEINYEIEDFQRRLIKCSCKNKKCNCARKK